MKKLFVLVLCLLCLTGCVKNLDNIPALSLAEELGEEWALGKLEGYSRQSLREIWDDPQRESEDGFGDVWFLDEAGEKRVTVRYDEKDRVKNVLLTVPGQEGVPTEPTTEAPTDEVTCVAPISPTDPATMSGAPDLTVFCSGKEVPAFSGGLTWVTELPDGTRAVLCADALHPLEMQKYLTVLEMAQTMAGLCFFDGDTQVWPGEIAVAAYPFDCTPDCDGLPFDAAVYAGGESVELLPGKYIYVVQTSWGDGEISGGRVTHVFAAERLYPCDE